jgi:hypothetical protein
MGTWARMHRSISVEEARDLYQRFGEVPFEPRRAVVEAMRAGVKVG